MREYEFVLALGLRVRHSVMEDQRAGTLGRRVSITFTVWKIRDVAANAHLSFFFSKFHLGIQPTG